MLVSLLLFLEAACILWPVALSSIFKAGNATPLWPSFCPHSASWPQLGRILCLWNPAWLDWVHLGHLGYSPQLKGFRWIPLANSLLPGKITCTGSGFRMGHLPGPLFCLQEGATDNRQRRGGALPLVCGGAHRPPPLPSWSKEATQLIYQLPCPLVESFSWRCLTRTFRLYLYVASGLRGVGTQSTRDPVSTKREELARKDLPCLHWKLS